MYSDYQDKLLTREEYIEYNNSYTQNIEFMTKEIERLKEELSASPIEETQKSYEDAKLTLANFRNEQETQKVELESKISQAEEKKAKRDFGRWFREMKSELKKVVWPTYQQVLKNAAIVCGCVIVVGIFIWLFDFVAQIGIDALISVFH